jgi:hypothetical protein
MMDTPWALLRQDNNEVKRLKRERDELQIKLKNWQEIANEFELERNQWRECAEILACSVFVARKNGMLKGGIEGLALFERLKEASK